MFAYSHMHHTYSQLLASLSLRLDPSLSVPTARRFTYVYLTSVDLPIGVDFGGSRARPPTIIEKCLCIHQLLPSFVTGIFWFASNIFDKSSPVSVHLSAFLVLSPSISWSVYLLCASYMFVWLFLYISCKGKYKHSMALI